MKLFGNRRRAAHAAPRQKLPRGTRAAIIAVCVVLALTGGVFAAWKLLVKPVQRPSLSQPDPEPVSEPDEAEPSVIRVTPHETEQPEEEPEPDVPTEQPKALQDGVYNILICGTDDDGTRTVRYSCQISTSKVWVLEYDLDGNGRVTHMANYYQP